MSTKARQHIVLTEKGLKRSDLEKKGLIMGTKQILETVFNDVRLVTFVYDNREVWFATQIAQVLGYSRVNKISTQIRGHWAAKFEEGYHFYTVHADVVRDISRLDTGNVSSRTTGNASRLTTGNVVSHSRHTMLLTEAGVNRVLMLTNKPVGLALQDHLTRVVLPQFRRGMIEERPIEELEAEWDKERTRLLEKTLSATERAEKYAAKLIERDEETMQLHREKAEMLGAKPYVSKMATNAGRSLQACKGAKKLMN